MHVRNPPPAVVLALASILLFLAGPTQALECAHLTASWPHGPADAVFTRHGRSYFGSGTVLVIGDVSDIFNPTVDGSLDLGMLIGDIVADGNLAWVAAGNFDGHPGALFTVDVTDPSRPEVIAQTATPLPARSLVVANGIAYVGLMDPAQPGQGRLLAIDLDRPDSPFTVSLPGWPEELNLDGDLLWVTELGDGARAFDVSEPLEPVEVAFEPGNVRDLDAADGILFLAEWGDNRDDALRIVDVTDPASPTELARYGATRPRSVEIFGRSAYMLSAPSESSIRFEVVDVSPPDDPVRLGILTLGPGGDLLINDLVVAASIAYVTHSQGGPVVVNTLDATEPRVAATFDTPGLATGLAINDDLLLVAAGGSGVAVVDLRTTTPAPSMAPSIPVPFASDVALSRSHAFVAAWDDGVRIFDVSDPDQPEEVATIETGRRFFRSVVDGHQLYASYLGNPYVETAIFDVADPAHPVPLATLQGGVMAVDRGYAYADWSDWLGQCAIATWDVSDPANPGVDPTRINFWGACARCDWPWPDYRRSYQLDPHRSISGMTIHGELAWVALGQGGLRALSLEDPSSPRQVASLAVDACGVTGVAAQRGTAFVATHSPSGLLAVRIEADGGLAESGFMPLAGFPVDAVLSGWTVYTANQTAGVSAIDVAACRPPLRATGRRTP